MNTSSNAKYSTLIDFEMSRAALRALGYMISATMSQGDSLSDIAMGVGQLIDTQCTELESIEEAIRAEFRRVDATAEQPSRPETSTPSQLRDQFIAQQAKAGVDPSEIAQALNLRRSAVDKVISQLTGKFEMGRSEESRVVNG